MSIGYNKHAHRAVKLQLVYIASAVGSGKCGGGCVTPTNTNGFGGDCGKDKCVSAWQCNGTDFQCGASLSRACDEVGLQVIEPGDVSVVIEGPFAVRHDQDERTARTQHPLP